jgi:hypothetical protein
VPRYDVKCRKCFTVCEISKKMSDPMPLCECGGQQDVYFSGAALPATHFTGGGWAADNYATVRKQQTVNQLLDKASK